MNESRRQWKLSELLERMQTEDPHTLIQREMERLCGRLEARGFRKVTLQIGYPPDADDESELSIEVRGFCPCGAEKVGACERWPIDHFRDGPHAFESRLTMIEAAFADKIDGVRT